MPSRSSKTLTSWTHCQSRCRCRHTVRHHYHLTYQSCSTPHLTCTHHVSTHASHSTTTWIAESTQRQSRHNHFSLCHSKHLECTHGPYACPILNSATGSRSTAHTPPSSPHHPSHAHTQPLGIHWHHPTDHAVGAAPSASYQQCCWLPSRTSKTWTSLRHHRRC